MSVQPRAARALLRSLLLMDLRAQHYGDATGAKAGALFPPLYWVFGQFLTTSLLTSLVLFTRVDAGFFAGANLLVALVSLFSAVVVELHEVVDDPSDRLVLGARPVTPATHAAARGGNLLAYVLLLWAATTVFPAIVGAAQLDAGPLWAPLYALLSLCVCLVATGAVVLLHLGFGAGPLLDGLRTGLAWVQIVGVMVGFYGGQLMLRNGTGSVEWFAAHPPPWFEALPSTALGDAVAAGSWGAWPVPLGFALLAGGGAAVGSGLLLVRAWGLRRERAVTRPTAAQGTARASLADGWTGRLTRSRAEAVGFWMFRALLLRDAELRSRSLPALAAGGAVVALGLLSDQFGDPLDPSTPLTDRVLPVAAVPLLAGAVPLLLRNALYSRDHAAGWRLAQANHAALGEGVRKAATLLVLLPAVLGLGLAAQVAWRHPLHAVAWTLLTWAAVVLGGKLVRPAALPGPPFSRPAARGGAMGPVMVLVAGVGTLAGALAGAASLLSPWPLAVGGLVGAALLAAAGVRRG